MNEQFPNDLNPEEEQIAQKLSQAAKQTQANKQFAADLEERLRSAYQPEKAGPASAWRQILPVLGWVAVMILLAIGLSWSIRTLITTPQPASNATPVTPAVLTPTPSPAILPEETATTPTDNSGYDWRGTKLYLSAPLPQGPTEAQIYSARDEQPATLDVVNNLAAQYGVAGSVYELPGSTTDSPSFLITDGKQRLYVQSDLSYDYYADYSAYIYTNGRKEIAVEQASTAIDAFLKSHGMDITYKVEPANVSADMFYVLPLTPDGLTLRHDHNMPARLEFTVDGDNQVLRVTSYQTAYDPIEGSYGMRSAEEAFQQILGQSDVIQNGVLEIMRSSGQSETGFWSRIYPDNQTLTLYGVPTFYPASQPGTPPFVAIGQFTATGNISGLEAIDQTTYVAVVGQFLTENGIRRFQVESWQEAGVPESYVSGTLRQDGDQVILTADDNTGDYVLVNAPADLPMNVDISQGDYLAVNGVIINNMFEWNTIQYFPAGSANGGGGGSGNGFYKINLSGTPAPFPTPTPLPQSIQNSSTYIVQEGDTCGSIAQQFGVSLQSIVDENQLAENCLIAVGQSLLIPGTAVQPAEPTYIVQENDTLASIASNFGVSVEELKQANDITGDIIYLDQKLFIPGLQTDNPLVGRRFDGQRGTLIIVIHRKPDGTSWNEFGFYSKQAEGFPLYLLLDNVSYESLLPYHNRPLDIWGSVKYVDRNGTPVVDVEKFEAPYPDLQFQILSGTQKVATLEGERLALFTATDGTTYAQLMSISLPDITMPGPEGSEVVLEVLVVPGEMFGGYPAIRVFNAESSQGHDLTIRADQPLVLDEQGDPTIDYIPPELTIEKVELVYYIPDPSYEQQSPTPGPHYIQPAWRFYGHYSDGSEVEFLVQALKQEFLLPELAPYRAPG